MKSSWIRTDRFGYMYCTTMGAIVHVLYHYGCKDSVLQPYWGTEEDGICRVDNLQLDFPKCNKRVDISRVEFYPIDVRYMFDWCKSEGNE